MVITANLPGGKILKYFSARWYLRVCQYEHYVGLDTYARVGDYWEKELFFLTLFKDLPIFLHCSLWNKIFNRFEIPWRLLRALTQFMTTPGFNELVGWPIYDSSEVWLVLHSFRPGCPLEVYITGQVITATEAPYLDHCKRSNSEAQN